MKIEIVKACLWDCSSLAGTLREADRKELAAISKGTPLASLQRCVSHSDKAWAVREIKTGRTLAVFGIREHPNAEGYGIIWMLGSRHLKHYRRELLTVSPGWIEEFHEDYHTLTNCVHAENTAHIRWLKWLGCSFGDKFIGGINGEEFIPFVHEKEGE